MPARNEIVPMGSSVDSAFTIGPNEGAVPLTVISPKQQQQQSSKAAKSQAANALAMSAQEQRIRLVSSQKRHAMFQLFYALFGVALMVVQMEYLWFANTQYLVFPCPVDETTNNQCPQCLKSLTTSVPVADGRMLMHVLRALISFSTVILVHYIYRYYAAECEVMKLKNIIPPKATLLSSSLRKRLFVELLVVIVHPFPGLDIIDPQWPTLVVTASLIMLCRVGLIIRVIRTRNSFNTSNGWFIASLTNVDFTGAFFLKSTFRNAPMKFLATHFPLLVVIVGYSLYVVERFLCAFSEDSCCQPLSLTDALWLLVMTTLTIGYGDVVPHTKPGRFFAILAGMSGMLFMAVTIAVTSQYLVFTRSEHKVNAFLKKDENKRAITDHAARAIKAFLQFKVVQRKFSDSKSKEGTSALVLAERKLFEALHAYRQIKRHVHSHDVTDPMDKQMTMLEMMEVNVEYIRTKIDDLAELYHTQMANNNKNINSNHVREGGRGNLSQLVATETVPTTAMILKVTSLDSINNHLHQQHQDRTSPFSPNDSLTAPQDTSTNETNHSIKLPVSSSSMDDSRLLHSVESSANHQSPMSKLNGQHHSNDVHSSNNMSEIPEWAYLLENTLQSILTQVNCVSTEVELVKTRVHNHIETVETRLAELEKRSVVRSALREIGRSKSKISVLHCDSSSISSPSSPTESKANFTSNTTMENGSNNHITSAVKRLSMTRRMLGPEMRRPSIRNFISQKDLEELYDE